MKGIAIRKFHLVRMKKKSLRIFGHEKYVNHLKVCLCHMCGNPRRNGWVTGKDKLTIQERKQDELGKTRSK